MNRCSWVDLKSEVYVKYHDCEWGVSVYDDRKLFEFLVLESFQAGLSWLCVLNKREAFRQVMDDFDPLKISCYTEDKIKSLLNNKDIIRSRRKIDAVINNAKVFLDIKEEWGSFSNYIWHFTDNMVIKNMDDKIMPTSLLSDEISKDLRKRGMKYVGSVIIYSYLQAIGVINDHELSCYLYKN